MSTGKVNSVACLISDLRHNSASTAQGVAYVFSEKKSRKILTFWKILKKWNKIHNLSESVSTSRQCSTSLIDHSTTRLDELLREAGNDAAGHDE